jgi:tRNA threonylcarbamoyladenosine biosynthesis protein TsaB
VILAVDTSTRVMGLALFDGSSVLGEMVWASADFHTVELAPAVAQILRQAGRQMGDLNALAVASGPGSFTGLRIGMALVKGLALARKLPLVAIPTLDVLAASQPVYSERRLLAVLRAGRGRLAVHPYRGEKGRWKPTGDLAVFTIEDLARSIDQPSLVAGELTVEERRILARKRKMVLLASPAQSVRRPAFLAQLGWERWQAGQLDDPASLAPVYLHHQEPLPG